MLDISNWLFNRSITGIWRAVKRDDLNEMWNDWNSPLVIKSKDILTLIEIIEKTDGDLNKLNYEKI